MIEAVYGEAAESLIPEGLRAASQRAEGSINAMSAQGRLNGLDLEDGYVATATHWQDDAYAPTRLGEPTVTVRLANTVAEGHLGAMRNEKTVVLWTGSIAAPVFTIEIPAEPATP